MKNRCFVAIAAAALLFSIDAAFGSESTDLVRKNDQVRCAAMMAGDTKALAGVLSNALVFVHSDGRRESKADYVKNLVAGDTAYANVETSDVDALEPAPGVVILIGTQRMKKRLGPTWSEINLRFMSVWRLESGAWRIFTWQSMRPSGTSTIPR